MSDRVHPEPHTGLEMMDRCEFVVPVPGETYVISPVPPPEGVRHAAVLVKGILSLVPLGSDEFNKSGSE